MAIHRYTEMLQPTSLFCCGCPLAIGLYIILGFHLLACIAYVVFTFSVFVLHVASVQLAWNPMIQMSMGGLYLCGIPIILAALFGVAKRVEVNVRVYLYYLTLMFVVDTVLLLLELFGTDACAANGGLINVLEADFGKAFVCGLMRISSYLIVAAAISIEFYCLFVVWSFCEEIHLGAAGPGLWGLFPGKDEMMKRKLGRTFGERAGPYADIIGLAHSKLSGPYPSPYGALGNQLPSYRILGGTEHAMCFPPPPDTARIPL